MHYAIFTSFLDIKYDYTKYRDNANLFRFFLWVPMFKPDL